MAATKKLEWKFPGKDIIFMKIETFIVAILGLLVFLFSFLQLRNFFLALVFTLVFFGLYAVIAYLIQLIRTVEEHYQLIPPHLHIIRKTIKKRLRARKGKALWAFLQNILNFPIRKGTKTKKEKIHLKKVSHHKLDRFFLGGYLVADKKRHALFFNTRKELEKFEKLLKKHIK